MSNTTMKDTATDFLPADYEAPKGNSAYMKFLKGENRFRILSKPIIGWLDWEDKKPLRFKMKDKPLKPVDPKQSIKHFWAVVVWDYSDRQIKVLEITQSTIQNAIQSLSKDADWGSPFGYDIKVIKTGDKLDTEYTVNPVPHKPVSQEIQDAYMEKPIDLTALFVGEDPFATNGNHIPDENPF